MNFCSNCGSALTGGAFCSKCGTKREPVVAQADPDSATVRRADLVRAVQTEANPTTGPVQDDVVAAASLVRVGLLPGVVLLLVLGNFGPAPVFVLAAAIGIGLIVVHQTTPLPELIRKVDEAIVSTSKTVFSGVASAISDAAEEVDAAADPTLPWNALSRFWDITSLLTKKTWNKVFGSRTAPSQPQPPQQSIPLSGAPVDEAAFSSPAEWAPPSADPAASAAAPLPPQPDLSARYNRLAIAAFVTSFFISIVGVALGHVALGEIRRTGERGRGLAIAGLVIGYIGVAIFALFLLFLFSIPLWID